MTERNNVGRVILKLNYFWLDTGQANLVSHPFFAGRPYITPKYFLMWKENLLRTLSFEGLIIEFVKDGTRDI